MTPLLMRQKKPHRRTNEELREIVYTAVGAASSPLWQTHPDDVFPSDKIIEAVESVLKEYNVPKE